MIERSKKSRSNNNLFNPYKNGISSYDIAYLSSKKVVKTRNFNLPSKDYLSDYLAS